jgi:hypothetical protein
VLFTPYGLDRPWIKGAWWPTALPFIVKLGAAFDRLRWQGQLADALKYFEAAEGASEKHRKELLRFIRDDWNRAPGIVAPPGYKPGLVESTGRGYEVYTEAEERADKDIQVALAGTPGPFSESGGLSKGNVWDTIRTDILAGTAAALATCLHEQVITPWAHRFYGAKDRAPKMAWDIRSPDQKKADGEAVGALADGVEKADKVLESRGERVNFKALLDQQGLALPTEPIPVKAPVASAPASLGNVPAMGSNDTGGAAA